MAIVKMKKMTLAAPKDIRRPLMTELMRLGCVEIDRPDLSDPVLAPLLEASRLRQDTADSAAQERTLEALERARALLGRFAPEKKPLLSPRRGVREFALFDPESGQQAAAAADRINELGDRAEAVRGEIRALSDKIEALRPWSELDIPLDCAGGRDFEVQLGGLPLFVKPDALRESLPEDSALWVVNEDKTRFYVAAVVHSDDAEAMNAALRAGSFTRDSFGGMTGLASENIARLNGELEERKAALSETEGALKSMGDRRGLIEQACDALSNDIARENARRGLLETESVFFFVGWLPEDAVKGVGMICERLGASCAFEDPSEGDDVPVQLKSNRFAEPFNEITAMYGMPAYDSFIDPTPSMAVFYILAFGLMLSDAAYGLLLALGCGIFLKRAKPKGSMRSMMLMFFLCGLSTAVWGFLLGGFFGNSVEVISTGLFGHKIVQWAWINPIDQPIQMMLVSYVFGAVQIFTAMFLDSLRRIKRGDWMGAIFGVYAWYLLFIGLGLLFLAPPVGKYVAIAGAVCVMIGGSLGKKGFGKITGGLMSLYNITGYFSDLLSYSRLLALCLSTAVVSNVVNTMGSLFGFKPLGVLAFMLVFVVGHVFNLALNLLGSYVHTSRLQYIEYFGRFYEGGGRPFEPLKLTTKYVDIIEEVN